LHLAIALVTALLLTVPFVLHEMQIEWQDYPNYRYYSSIRTFVDLEAARWTLAISTGWMLPNDSVVPPAQRVLPQAVTDAGGSLALALLVAGMLAAAIGSAHWKSRASRANRIRLAGLLLWVVLPVAFTIRRWQPLFLHYFFASLPAVFLLMAVPCSSNLLAGRRVLRYTSLVARSAVAAIAAFQLASMLGGLAYQAAAAGTDPCFMPPLEVRQALEAEVAQLGHASGSTGAFVELDDGDAKAMAYLLRASFPDVYLSHTRALSQTPTLVGNVGLGALMPTPSLTRSSSRTPNELTASVQPELQYANGVIMHSVLYAPHSTGDQHVRLAMSWSVPAEPTAAGPVVWEIALLGEDGQALQADSGDPKLLSILRGQTLVSWFSFDTRRERAPDAVPPGMYQVRLRLIDTSTERNVEVPIADAGGNPGEPVRLPVEISPFNACDLPSVIP
jgi:hypothetical protein